MWQSVEISVNKSEEDYLMSYLNERLYRTAHFFADEAEWAKEKQATKKALVQYQRFNIQNGGQGWIRTIVAYGDGFTVRSL